MLEADAEAPEGELALVCRLPDGRAVVATFVAAPADREAKERRLEMLVEHPGRRAGRAGSRAAIAPPGDDLPPRRAVGAVCARGGAQRHRHRRELPGRLGRRSSGGRGRPAPAARRSPRMAETPANERRGARRGNGGGLEARRARASAALPDIAALRKGKHLRSVARDAEVPFVAHSFASIYLLVVVYDQPFDELRAERAIVDSLPRIERLVLALPPLDPAPSLRGSRCRRHATTPPAVRAPVGRGRDLSLPRPLRAPVRARAHARSALLHRAHP